LKKIQTEFPAIKITKSKEAIDFIRNFYSDDIEIFESMFLLMLNRNAKTIGYAKISQGGISGTAVDVRIIAKFAVEAMASSVVVVHNHPSGNTKMSQDDFKIMNIIKNALKLLEIDLLDFMIITADDYHSTRDNLEL
jgi:DNA repair protein RadC